MEDRSHGSGATRGGVGAPSSSVFSPTDLSGGEDVRVVAGGAAAAPRRHGSRLFVAYVRLRSFNRGHGRHAGAVGPAPPSSSRTWGVVVWRCPLHRPLLRSSIFSVPHYTTSGGPAKDVRSHLLGPQRSVKLHYSHVTLSLYTQIRKKKAIAMGVHKMSSDGAQRWCGAVLLLVLIIPWRERGACFHPICEGAGRCRFIDSSVGIDVEYATGVA